MSDVLVRIDLFVFVVFVAVLTLHLSSILLILPEMPDSFLLLSNCSSSGYVDESNMNHTFLFNAA